MSNLNDRDADLQYLNSRNLFTAYYALRQELRDSQQIPTDELEVLVMGAYALWIITEGKACEILGCNRIEFRDKYLKFLDENPDVKEFVKGI